MPKRRSRLPSWPTTRRWVWPRTSRAPPAPAIRGSWERSCRGGWRHEPPRGAPAVGRVIPQIAAAVKRIVAVLRRGGRVIYVGAGTSGRLGWLDAMEVPPTFGVDPGMVRAVVAGRITEPLGEGSPVDSKRHAGGAGEGGGARRA